MKKSGRSILLTLVLLLGVCLATWSRVLAQQTLVRQALPEAAALLLALLSGAAGWRWRVWRRLTRTERLLPNYLCHVLCVGVVAAAAFYIGNYAFADDGAGHADRAVVGERLHVVRYRTRRISQRRYARGDPYDTYYLRVRFADGLTRRFPVPRDRYARLHEGDTIPLFVSRGLFGVPVVKYENLFREAPAPAAEQISR